MYEKSEKTHLFAHARLGVVSMHLFQNKVVYEVYIKTDENHLLFHLLIISAIND